MTSLALAALAGRQGRFPFPIEINGSTMWVWHISNEFIEASDDPQDPKSARQEYWLFESEEDAGEVAVERIESMDDGEIVEHLGPDTIMALVRGGGVYHYDAYLLDWSHLIKHIRANPEKEIGIGEPGETVGPDKGDTEKFLRMLDESGWDYLVDEIGFEPGFAMRVG